MNSGLGLPAALLASVVASGCAFTGAAGGSTTPRATAQAGNGVSAETFQTAMVRTDNRIKTVRGELAQVEERVSALETDALITYGAPSTIVIPDKDRILNGPAATPSAPASVPAPAPKPRPAEKAGPAFESAGNEPADTLTVPPPPAVLSAGPKAPGAEASATRLTPPPVTPPPVRKAQAAQAVSQEVTRTQPAPMRAASGESLHSILFGVHLASYKHMDNTRRGWTIFQEKYPAQFAAKQARAEKVDLGAKGEFLRLRAGPYASMADAAKVCDVLHADGLYCVAQGFGGRPLDEDPGDARS